MAKKEAAITSPEQEITTIIREATRQVEEELRLEDVGWLNYGATSIEVVTALSRVSNVNLSRLYYVKDPLAHQAIRLWTDYTFGTGLTWKTPHDNAKKVIEAFWNSPANKAVFSARGQRMSCDKVLVDGEIFFAIFLGEKGKEKIRRIDPLEITEIITDPDDKEDIRYYRRQWADTTGEIHDGYYRSTTNIKDVATPSPSGDTSIQKTEDALIYQLTYNTTGQRGNPLLLPALDWIKQYRRFLASRIAIMLALARFAWKTKVTGGQTAVNAVKAKTEGKEINAGSILLENLGSDTTPIKTDSGARNAYDDGRQIKLMIFSAVGISEQYFGDISTGNLATAKTVELPMMKMFQSFQKVWEDTYKDINEVVLAHNNVPPEDWYVDLDFPPITPADVAQIALSLKDIIAVMPDFAYSDDVMQIALMSLGINDPQKVLEELTKEAKKNPEAALAKALKQFRESLKGKE